MPELTDVQWIFLILAVLYLIESLVWVRPRGVPWTIRGGGAAPRRARSLIGNESGWLHTGGWSPSHGAVVTEPFPLAMSPAGVVAFVADSPLSRDRPLQNGRRWIWDDLHSVSTDGPRLMDGNGGFMATLSSPTAARLAAERITQIADELGDRTRAIEGFHREMMDADRVAERIDQWESSTGGVRSISWLLALWIFGVGGALYFDVLPVAVDDRLVYAYLGVGLAIWWIGVAMTVAAHGRLYPDDRAGWWKTFLLCLASPAVVLRSADLLSRPLVGIAHPAVMLGGNHDGGGQREGDEDCRRRIARDFHHPALPDKPTPRAGEPSSVAGPQGETVSVEEIIEWDHRIRWAAFAEPIRRAYRFGDVPPGRDGDATRFCPRCEQWFASGATVCSDCGDRPLVTTPR